MNTAKIILTTLALTTLAGEASATLPRREWGTYVGGSDWDELRGVALDAEGNVYACGRTLSPDGIATPGTHKPDHDGSWDSILVKFSPAGERLWGTYFGGDGEEHCIDLALRGEQIALVGITMSTTGIATPGAFHSENPGGYACGYVAVFTPAGVQTWGAVLCGPDDSVATSAVTIDAGGTVFVGGNAGTTIPGLTTPASHQPERGNDDFEPDGYLVRFGAQGQLAWGTYYGGWGWDQVHGVSINDLGELYLAGTSESPQGIASPGAHKAVVEYYDAFLARFTPDGQRVWGTYYGGAEGDTATVLALPQGGALMLGQTDSLDGIATAGTHQTMLAGGYDNFLAQFDADGKPLWGTYQGGPGDDDWNIRGALDPAGNIYLTTRTKSLTGVATPGAFQNMLAGPEDALLVSFDAAGQLRWSTYYGGPGPFEWDFSLAVAPAGDLYLVGMTSSATGIASPGAHDTQLDGDHDGLLVRFSQTLGSACEGPADCGGGPCVDGVCCDDACGDGAEDCQACAARLGATADGLCTLLGPAITCRPVSGACDAAEVCDGQSVDCPADVPAPDGALCEVGACDAGVCIPDVETSTTDPTGGDTTTTAETTTTGEPDPTESVPEDSTGPTTGHVPEDSTGPTSGHVPGDSTDGGATGGALGETGCGCRHDANPPAPLALALLLLLRRRRPT